MKPLITLLAVGSQGDLNPACALAHGLQTDYRVRVATHRNFARFVTQQGIEFAPLAGNFQELLGSEVGYQLFEGKKVKLVQEELFREILQDGLQACLGSRALICFPLAIWGYHIAEKLGIPCFIASYVPLSSTRAFAFLRFGTPTQNPFQAWLNRWSYYLFEVLFWQRDRRVINVFRRELGLPPLPLGIRYRRQPPPHLATVPILYCFSSSVIPKPLDWDEHLYITGYWFLNAPYEPPQRLVDFLRRGAIYIGFGSMTTRYPQRLTEIVLNALQLTHQRAVLLSGWAGLGQESLPENVLILNDYVPFDWLFGHVNVVVHHGGSGTTALGLRAGIPQVIVPFFADQPAWGNQLAHLGVSPRPIPSQQLSAPNLASAIDDALKNAPMRQRAKALGEKIRAENGVETAVAIINRYLG